MEIRSQEKLPGVSHEKYRPITPVASAPPQIPIEDEEDRTPPVWLQRTSLVMLVAICLYVGALLLALPWTRFYDENHLLALLPQRVSNVAQSGAVRGLISGFGLLDIWIGLSEAIYYREVRGPRRAKDVR
jgi:hypothetical protein